MPLERERTPAGLSFYVRRIELEGNTVLEPAAVAAIVRDFENREIDSDGIEDLRLRLTRLYISRGYVNSGVIVPDQDVVDGVFRLRAIEGRITRIEILGEGLRLRPGYIEPRLALGSAPVLNLNQLRDRIEIMQQDGPIERINAEIVPDIAPGAAVLRAQVAEPIPYQIAIGVNNHRNTAVGEVGTELFLTHRNLTGWGDRIEARSNLTRGVNDYSLAYIVPINAHDTTLSFSRAMTDATVIESTLSALDISNRLTTDAIVIEHPLWRSTAAALRVSLARERRRSETYLLGAPFSFTPGIPDTGPRVNLWRLAASWLKRDADAVLAARLQLSHGDSNVTATTDPAAPQRTFNIWLGQVHWARRIAAYGSQLLARFDFQETTDVLLPIERFGLGGANSVRGFRENQLLRDRGLLASVEYRHPLLGKDRPELQGAVFVDHGRASNRDNIPVSPTSLSSIGVGLLWSPNRQTNVQIYYAHGSHRFPSADNGFQDRGIHFSASYGFF